MVDCALEDVRPLRVVWTVVLLGVLLCQGALALPLLAVYPEVVDPYREAFEQIMDGLAQTSGLALEKKMITATTSPEDLFRFVEDLPTVLLGQRTVALYERTKTKNHPVFIGAVNAVPGQITGPGISLTLDPTLYLQTLHELAPHIRRIVVYYNAREQQWFSQVESAASTRGLSVEGIATPDALELVRQLGATFKTLDPTTTALWFGRNTLALNPNLLYPYVFEQTWDRHIVAFSEVLSHARLGLLFAIHSDYIQYGRELGVLIEQKAPAPVLRFSRSGQLALNARTAQHLGIALSDELLRRARSVFPQP